MQGQLPIKDLISDIKKRQMILPECPSEGMSGARPQVREFVRSLRRQHLISGEYGPPKTAAGVRNIPLPDDLRRDLIDLRLASKHSQDDAPIFASREGTPLQHRNVAHRGFERAAKEAEIQGVSFHDLRHAAASRLIANGLDPVTSPQSSATATRTSPSGCMPTSSTGMSETKPFGRLSAPRTSSPNGYSGFSWPPLLASSP